MYLTRTPMFRAFRDHNRLSHREINISGLDVISTSLCAFRKQADKRVEESLNGTGGG